MSASDDGLALVLLSTTLGRARGTELPVLGPVGWSELGGRLKQAGLPPGVLLGMSPESLTTSLRLSTEQAERVSTLLRRAGPVAIELERLADRGFWYLTAVDFDYPDQLRRNLGTSAPPVLFGAGSRSLLGASSVAVVGSRDADPAALAFAGELGTAAAAGGLAIASGGARGVDQAASSSAIEAGGQSVVIAPEQLERRVREPSAREAIAADRLVMASPYPPGAGFSVRGAMGRNKIVYALAMAAVVVAAKEREGGTWAGATEAIRSGTVPVFVRPGSGSWSEALLRLGAQELAWSTTPPTLTAANFALTGSVMEAPEQAILFDELVDSPEPPKKGRAR